jgi:hypothetical protein
MGYGLLGAHVNTTVGGVPELISEWKPPIVVILDHSDVWHDVKRASPQTLFVGRLFQQSEPDFGSPDLDPIEAARDHCDKILPWAERMGQTYSFWQGVNEPIIHSTEAMKRYAAFDAERAHILDKEGFGVVVGTFSVGNPELNYWNEFLPALEAARQYGGALALHEYAWPTLDHEWPWYLLRHRKVYAGEPAHQWPGLPDHLRTLPLLITECGLDGLIELGHPPRGWRVLYSQRRGEYLRQLSWYGNQLMKDPYVVGAALYCCGVADQTWHSYDIWPGIARALRRRSIPVYRLAETQPEEPLEPVEPPEPVEPIEPSQPAEPTEPVEPIGPSEPAEPTEPVEPIGPSEPAEPTQPVEPVGPSEPAEPTQPVEPIGPSEPAEPTEPVVSGGPFERTEPIKPAKPLGPVGAPATGWQMDVEHRDGAPIIAGSLPRAGIELNIADPWGNVNRVVSGSKPEYGEGGFEVLAPHAVSYTVTFLDEAFKIKTQGRAVILTFTEAHLVDEEIGLPMEPSEPADDLAESPDEPTAPEAEPFEPPSEPETPADDWFPPSDEPIAPEAEPHEAPSEPEAPVDDWVEPPYEPMAPEDQSIEALADGWVPPPDEPIAAPSEPEAPVDDWVEPPYEPMAPEAEPLKAPSEPETAADDWARPPGEPIVPEDQSIEALADGWVPPPDEPIAAPSEPEAPVDDWVEPPYEPMAPEDEAAEPVRDPVQEAYDSTKALDEDTMLDMVAERLDDIIAALRDRL